MIFYTANDSEPFFPKAALSEIAGQEVRLAHDDRGFRLVLPDGSESENAWASYSGDSQPDVATIAAWRPTEPASAVTAVERIANTLAGREQTAAAAITALKASAALALMQGGMSQDDTNAAGSALVVQHSAVIQAYILAGGNPLTGQALLDAILASPPAWWSPAQEAIFTAGLGL